ncbi:MAG: helix-turn-helix transcriptional regulator [Ruthenibacterium lactatiformans]
MKKLSRRQFRAFAYPTLTRRVSNRSISRWENGINTETQNAPDFDLLIELAKYYKVEVSEILDGERTAGADGSAEELMLKIADYSNIERKVFFEKNVCHVCYGTCQHGFFCGDGRSERFGNGAVWNHCGHCTGICGRHVFIRQPVYFKNGNRQNAFGERIAETQAIGKNKAAGYPRGFSISLFFRHSTFRLFPQLQPPQE